MYKKISIIIILFIGMLSARAQDTIPPCNKISLLFIGDIMGHDAQILSAEDERTRTYNYDDVFTYVRNQISEADLAIANLEVTLAGPPYKGYPAFSSPAALAAACKNAGIDFMVTANNHSADRGKKGIISTINRLDSLGIPHTGTFTGPAAKDSLHPAIIVKNGFRLALLNYTYGTNGITVQAPAIVNMLDKNTVANDIEKTKELNPDVIILLLHWGVEYDTIPARTQSDLASYFFSLGADIIIGSHPHVIQRMEWEQDSLGKDRLLVYSLGNFVSNQRRLHTDGGAMVRIELARSGDTVKITNAGYYLTWVYTPMEDNKKRFYILPCRDYENKPDFFPDPSDYEGMMVFTRNARELLDNQNINFPELNMPVSVQVQEE